MGGIGKVSWDKCGLSDGVNRSKRTISGTEEEKIYVIRIDGTSGYVIGGYLVIHIVIHKILPVINNIHIENEHSII